MFVAIPVALGLLMYLVMANKYFLQIREAGALLEELERELTAVPATLGLLTRIRHSPAAFFKEGWPRGLVVGYLLGLIAVVMLSAFLTPPA